MISQVNLQTQFNFFISLGVKRMQEAELEDLSLYLNPATNSVRLKNKQISKTNIDCCMARILICK